MVKLKNFIKNWMQKKQKNQSKKYLRYEQNRRMRNIIFYNIPEETGEDFHKLESMIIDLLKNQL